MISELEGIRVRDYQNKVDTMLSEHGEYHVNKINPCQVSDTFELRLSRVRTAYD